MNNRTMKLMPLFLAISLVTIFPFTYVYAQPSEEDYSFHVGQWIKYGSAMLDVKADNNYMRLLAKAKALISKSMQIPISASDNMSMLDLDWLLTNVSKIEGNEVTITTSIKSKLSKDVISRSFLAPMNTSDSINSNVFTIYLTKAPKVGDTFYTYFAGSPFPLQVNRTLEKYIGNHVISGYEITGTRNSYQDTDGTATETTINLFYGKQSPWPLEIRLSMEAGSPLYGTISVIFKLTAIDLSI
jgi:hypothetical protein